MKDREIAKSALKTKGITQEIAAKYLGVTRSNLAVTLNRDGGMTVKKFGRIIELGYYDIAIMEGDKVIATVNPYSPADVVRLAMANRGVSQEKLAKLAGWGYQTKVSNFLNKSASMQVANLVRMIEALDYKVVVIDSVTNEIFAEVDM